ncbi:MAG: substrate-binding domain-containing protein [Verrucomicrobia bacterium]|nr:substrate-binding domain-containing protein [Verrucomicrobiota bacterium]
MLEWYRCHRPDVLIVTESWIMDSFLNLAGLRMPEDVPAIAISADFGDLSGVRQGAESIGWAAADILTAHIIRNERGIPERPKTMMVEGSWVDRGSVLPLAGCKPSATKKPRTRRQKNRPKVEEQAQLVSTAAQGYSCSTKKTTYAQLWAA